MTKKEVKQAPVETEELTTNEITEHTQETGLIESLFLSGERKLSQVNAVTGEICDISLLTPYMIMQRVDGKFKRSRIFRQRQSHIPETKEQKLNYYKTYEENKNVREMKNMHDQEIKVVGYHMSPYEKPNEETSLMEFGVVISLLLDDGSIAVTSSKNVAMKVETYENLLGMPSDENVWNVRVIRLTSKQNEQHTYNDLELVD